LHLYIVSKSKKRIKQNSLQAYFLESLAQADEPSSSLAKLCQIDCFIKSMPRKSFFDMIEKQWKKR